MKIDVLNIEGAKVSQVTTKKEFFEAPVNNGLLYEAVKMNRSNKREGNASTKTRSEVSGSGKKLWKQKGTGRARVGSVRSPVWRHGGVVFGPHPRDYSYSIPKKAMRQAVRSAIAHKFAEGKLRIFDAIELNAPKTKTALGVFKKAGMENALIVTGVMDRNLMLAIRNMRAFKLTDAKTLNVYDILKYDGLVFTKDAFEKVMDSFKPIATA
ncbi:MAG: 50S ribosomal protein L4 [Thermodesulfobacteriota bacterium]